MQRRTSFFTALSLITLSLMAPLGPAQAQAGNRGTSSTLRFVFELAVVEMTSNDTIGVTALINADPRAGAPLKAGYLTLSINQEPPALGDTVRVAGVIQFASFTDKQAFLAGHCAKGPVCLISSSPGATPVEIPQGALTAVITPSRHMCKETSVTSPVLTQKVRACRVNNQVLLGVFEPPLTPKNSVWVTANSVTRRFPQRNTMVSIGSARKPVTLVLTRRDSADAAPVASSEIKI